MTGELTSPHSAGTWRRFAAFVRRPHLPDHATGFRTTALPVLGKLFALDLLLMALLIGVAALATALGVGMPEHLLDQMEFTPLLLAFILIGAPLGEELLFRGWLSGKPGHVGALVSVLVAAAAATLAASAGVPWLALAFVVAGLVIAFYLLWRHRGRPPLPFFQRHFRWFYLFSTAAFASVHLANFTEGNALILLPLTLPQFLLGLILGFARVQFGLWASILMHAAHNSLFVGLILAGAS